MALLVRSCNKCKAEFEVLTTIAHDFACPTCGADDSRKVFVPLADFVYTNPFTGEDATLDHQFRMRGKTELDKRSAEIRSGELDLKLNGPREYWPDVTKEKRLY